MSEERQILAVFIDFENLALGFRDREEKFEMKRVLERLVEKGDIVVKRAYSNWTRFANYTNALHEAAIELFEIPRRAMTGKNSADMRLCVDVMDLCYSKPHITTFVILSGDSDFSPLVSKLKENGKQVIGVGMRNSTSNLLSDNCHEFIYYEDLQPETDVEEIGLKDADEQEKEVFGLLMESLQALRRENRDTLWSSMIKDTMKRKRPSFNESSYGYKMFSRLLEEAERRGLVELDRDESNRSLFVSRFGGEIPAKEPEKKSARPAAKAPAAKPAATDKPAGDKPASKSRVRRKRPVRTTPNILDFE